jgi:hypothetical protein
MQPRIVNVACLILLTVSACGGQPSAPAAAPPATPTTLCLVTVPADATPTATPFQPGIDDTGISGFSAVMTETPPAATIYPDAIIPATITPSGARDRHLTYGGHPRNAGRLAENMALDALRRSALETS